MYSSLVSLVLGDVKKKAYSNSLYGTDGVSADSMDSFFCNFYPNGSFVNPDSLSGGLMGNSMLYFNTSDSTGHAVNGYYYDSTNGTILYNDLQTGGQGTICIQDVEGVYFP